VGVGDPFAERLRRTKGSDYCPIALENGIKEGQKERDREKPEKGGKF